MRNKAHSVFNVLKVFLIPVLVISLCFVFLAIRLPRQVGLAARYDLTIVFIPLILLSYFFFRLPGRVGEILAPIFLMVVFALPLSGLWASGTSEQYIVGGTIPASDSMLYNVDALRLLNGGTFSLSSADKPLSPLFSALMLGITGQSPRSALILILILPILATYLAMREIQREYGTLVAAVFLAVVFLYYRPYIGTFMTESLGLSFGLLAFAFLLRYTSDHKPAWLFSGLTCLTLGLCTRQGAFLILPLIVLWISWQNRKQVRQLGKQVGLAVLAVGLGFLGNQVVLSTTSDANTTTNSQFALHIYSLATGGQYWNQLRNDHPEINQLQGSAFLLRGVEISFHYFIQHPEGLFQGIFKEYSTYFSDVVRGEFSFIDGSSDTVNQIFRVGTFLLAGVGIGSLFRRRRQAIRGIFLICVAGFLLSIPFVTPSTAFRARLFGATIWIEAFMVGLGTAWLLEFLAQWGARMTHLLPLPEPIRDFPLIAFSTALVVLLAAGLLVIRLTARQPSLPLVTCPAGQKVVSLRVEPGSYVVLVDHSDPRQGQMPYIRRSYFALAVHNQPHSGLTSALESLDKPTALIFGLDLISHDLVLVLTPAELYSERPGLISACGNYKADPAEGTGFFFYANSIKETGRP